MCPLIADGTGETVLDQWLSIHRPLARSNILEGLFCYQSGTCHQDSELKAIVKSKIAGAGLV